MTEYALSAVAGRDQTASPVPRPPCGMWMALSGRSGRRAAVVVSVLDLLDARTEPAESRLRGVARPRVSEVRRVSA